MVCRKNVDMRASHKSSTIPPIPGSPRLQTGAAVLAPVCAEPNVHSPRRLVLHTVVGLLFFPFILQGNILIPF